MPQEEQMKLAQHNFHLVGSSASECDTIPGRQCMASSYFLAGQFEEVLVYLNSIKSFFVNDDTFNFNYAQVRCSFWIKYSIIYVPDTCNGRKILDN